MPAKTSPTLLAETRCGLWLAIGLRTVVSLPYLKACGERLDGVIVLIHISLKRSQMVVGIAPGSDKVAVWLEQEQRHTVGLHRSDRCGDVLGAVVFIGNGRRDGRGRLQP